MVYQYIAFKTRNIDYLKPLEKNNFAAVKAITRSEGFDNLTAPVNSVEYSFKNGHVDILWDTVREAPLTIAHRKKEFIVQMIDEFQFMNAMIYRDKNLDKLQYAMSNFMCNIFNYCPYCADTDNNKSCMPPIGADFDEK